MKTVFLKTSATQFVNYNIFYGNTFVQVTWFCLTTRQLQLVLTRRRKCFETMTENDFHIDSLVFQEHLPAVSEFKQRWKYENV